MDDIDNTLKILILLKIELLMTLNTQLSQIAKLKSVVNTHLKSLNCWFIM